MDADQVQQILIRLEAEEPSLSELEFQSQTRNLVQNYVQEHPNNKFSARFLHSEIPKDLQNLFLNSNLPKEGLNVATELSKSALALPETSSSKGAIAKISKNLVQLWMRNNSCAEAFARFCIYPSTVSETTNFSRNLFAIPDNFQLNHNEFPRFILQQVLLTVTTLSKLVEQESATEIRTSALSSAIDRLFLRFFIDEERFYPYFDSEENIILDAAGGKDGDPFFDFFVSATSLGASNFIGRRLFGKILMSVGQNSMSKICKMVFLVEAATNGESPATSILYPPQEFLSMQKLWKQSLTLTIPLKSRVQNLNFFSTWAEYISKECSPSELIQVWKSLASSWVQLIKNVYTDAKVMISSTFALVALIKAFKSEVDTLRESVEDSPLSSFSSVFDGVQSSLSSTDSVKHSCGMAVGQVVSDLLRLLRKPGSTPLASAPTDTGNVENPTTELNDSLKFESDHPIFLKCVSYYEDKTTLEVIPIKKKNTLTPRHFYMDFDDVLDSDDDVDDEEEPKADEDDEETEFEPYDMSNDTPVNESMMNLKSLNKKIPNYFSEICEVLTESASSRDESAMESLKRIAILKIPVLLFQGVKIDSSMAGNLVRVLADLDSDGLMEIPAICGLHEIATAHPDRVFSIMANIAFDKEHYSVGHRMVVLARYNEVLQLLSKQICFSCFKDKSGKLAKLLEDIHPPFIRDYMSPKQALPKCKRCIKFDGAVVSVPGSASSKLVPPPPEPEAPGKMLTWREVIERRVAAKTRRFGSKPKQPSAEVADVYSAKLIPIIWGALANKLVDNAPRFLTSGSPEHITNASFVAQVFRILGKSILGTAGVNCPHIRNLASQTSDLVSSYSHHSDAQVRRSVLSLLALVIASSEGKEFIMEIFLGKQNTFEELKSIFENDSDSENRKLFSDLYQLVNASALVQIGHLLAEK